MRYEKEVAWKFFGDVAKAQRHIPLARTAAGGFFSTNVNELEQLTRRVPLAEDVWCQIKKIPGQVIIEIHAETPQPEKPEEYLAGFIVASDDGKEGILKWNDNSDTWSWVPRSELTELSYGNAICFKDTKYAVASNATKERHLLGSGGGQIFLNGRAVQGVFSGHGATIFDDKIFIVSIQYPNIFVYFRPIAGGTWSTKTTPTSVLYPPMGPIYFDSTGRNGRYRGYGLTTSLDTAFCEYSIILDSDGSATLSKVFESATQGRGLLSRSSTLSPGISSSYTPESVTDNDQRTATCWGLEYDDPCSAGYAYICGQYTAGQVYSMGSGCQIPYFCTGVEGTRTYSVTGTKSSSWRNCSYNYTVHDELVAPIIYVLAAEPDGTSTYVSLSQNTLDYHSYESLHQGADYSMPDTSESCTYCDSFRYLPIICDAYNDCACGTGFPIKECTSSPICVYTCSNDSYFSSTSGNDGYSASSARRIVGTNGLGIILEETSNSFSVNTHGGEQSSGTYCQISDSSSSGNASLYESWSNTSSSKFTLGYDPRCGAWLYTECLFFRAATIWGQAGSPGTGVTRVVLRLPSGAEITLATLNLAIAAAGQDNAGERQLTCSGSASGCIINGTPVGPSFLACYQGAATYSYSDYYDILTDYYTPPSFPRHLPQLSYGSPFLPDGLVNRLLFQGNADIIDVSFQCNQDTFGHWLISVYVVIQEFTRTLYNTYIPVNAPISLTHTWLSTGEDPLAIVGSSGYFTDVSVTGKRKK